MAWLIDEKLTITWTAVPCGVVDGKGGKSLRLSIVVAPRMSSAQSLEGGIGNRFFSDWPRTLRESLNSFDVSFADGDTLVASTRASVVGLQKFDSRAWKTIFKSTDINTDNEGEPNFSNLRQNGSSYNALAIRNQTKFLRILDVAHSMIDENIRVAASNNSDWALQGLALEHAYSSMLNSIWSTFAWSRNDSDNFPFHSQLQSFGNEVDSVDENDLRGESRRTFQRNLYRMSVSPEKFVRDDVRQLACMLADSAEPNNESASLLPNAVDFYESTAFNSRVERLPGSYQDPIPESYDFAQLLGMVRNYPFLSKRIGLLLELQIPESKIQEFDVASFSNPRLWVSPNWKPGFGEETAGIFPSTWFDFSLTEDLFFASESQADGTGNDSDHVDGYLKLRNSGFALSTLDTDGAAIKIVNAAESLLPTIVPEFLSDRSGKILTANQGAVGLVCEDGSTDFLQIAVTDFLNNDSSNRVIDGLGDLEHTIYPGRKVRQKLTFKHGGGRFGEYSNRPAAAEFEIETVCVGTTDNLLYKWRMVTEDGTEVSKPSRIEFPAQRSIGLALLRVDSASDVANSEDRNRTLFSEANPLPGEPRLAASDLILGYVPEIWAPPAGNPDGSPQWYSTTRREEKYTVLGGEIHSSEGVISVAIAETNDDAPVYQSQKGDAPSISPSLFVYTNNSLGCSQKYGSWEMQDDDSPTENEKNSPAEIVDLMPARGTLPLVRYSSASKKPFQYAVRCRYVDIAGNSRPKDNRELGDDSLYLETYINREEPIAPPNLLTVGTHDLSCNPGSSERIMVTRENQCVDTRVVVPAKTSPDMALKYGKILGPELANRGGLDSVRLTRRADIPVETCIQPSESFSPDRKTPVFCPPTLGQPGPDAGYYYLPDPAACHAVVELHTFHSEALKLPPLRIKVPFYGDFYRWPKAKAIRIELRRLPIGEIEPTLEQQGHVVLAGLPPGWTGHLDICSVCADKEIQHLAPLADMRMLVRNLSTVMTAMSNNDLRSPLFALQDGESPVSLFADTHYMRTGSLFEEQFENIFQMFAVNLNSLSAFTTGGLDANDPVAFLNNQFEQGIVRAVSPKSRVWLHCAVQRPLYAPNLQVKDADRDEGTESLDLEFKTTTDAKSTSEFSVMVSWRRLQDDVGLEEPRIVRDREEFTYKVGDPVVLDPTTTIVTQNLDLRTTNYRKARYRVRGFSRFANFYRSTIKEDFTLAGRTDVVIRHLNCAKPKKIEVERIVPTLSWSTRTEGLINRPGRKFLSKANYGIRVYLHRGWNLGELLGVVTLPALSQDQVEQLNENQTPRIKNAKEVPPHLYDSVTQWGADPITNSNLPEDLPSPVDFAGYRKIGRKLILPALGDNSSSELDGLPKPLTNPREVSVVGFRPQWSKERQLWFCDIGLIRIPTYGCFLRMALVRYQPNSNEFLELSSPIRADFVQLRPNRSVSIARDPRDRRSKTLLVSVTENVGEGETPLNRTPRGKEVINQFKLHVERPIFANGIQVGWIVDEEIDVNEERSNVAGTLWHGKLVAQKPASPRRLVIREFEVWPDKSSREIFCNVLEL